MCWAKLEYSFPKLPLIINILIFSRFSHIFIFQWMQDKNMNLYKKFHFEKYKYERHNISLNSWIILLYICRIFMKQEQNNLCGFVISFHNNSKQSVNVHAKYSIIFNSYQNYTSITCVKALYNTFHMRITGWYWQCFLSFEFSVITCKTCKGDSMFDGRIYAF